VLVVVRERLQQFQAFLAEKGRRVVMAAFVGPNKVTTLDLPAGKRFRLEGEARVGKLLISSSTLRCSDRSGIVCGR